MISMYHFPGRAPDPSHGGGEKNGEEPMEEGVDAPDRPGAANGDSEWISAAMETSSEAAGCCVGDGPRGGRDCNPRLALQRCDMVKFDSCKQISYLVILSVLRHSKCTKLIECLLWILVMRVQSR